MSLLLINNREQRTSGQISRRVTGSCGGGDQFQKGGGWQEKNLSWNPVIIKTVSVHHSISTNSSSLNISSFLNSASSLNSSSSLSSSSSLNSFLHSQRHLLLKVFILSQLLLLPVTGRLCHSCFGPPHREIGGKSEGAGGGKLVRERRSNLQLCAEAAGMISACFLRCL